MGTAYWSYSVLVKVKVTPWRAYAGTKGRRRHSSHLYTPSKRRIWVVSITLRPPYPWERRDSCCAWGWLGPVWTDTEILTPHRHSIPGPSSQYGIRRLTQLSRWIIFPLPPLALQHAVDFGLSNNTSPFFPIYHQLSPSSHSQHLKISFHYFSPSFPGSSSSSRPFQFLSEDLFGASYPPPFSPGDPANLSFALAGIEPG